MAGSPRSRRMREAYLVVYLLSGVFCSPVKPTFRSSVSARLLGTVSCACAAEPKNIETTRTPRKRFIYDLPSLNGLSLLFQNDLWRRSSTRLHSLCKPYALVWTNNVAIPLAFSSSPPLEHTSDRHWLPIFSSFPLFTSWQTPCRIRNKAANHF